MFFVNTDCLTKKDAEILKAQIEQQAKERRMLELDYKARLKDDLEAILVELQSEIEEIEKFTNTVGWELRAKTPEEIKKECLEIIQQKINDMREHK